MNEDIYNSDMREIFLCGYFFRYCYSSQHCLTVQLPTDPARKRYIIMLSRGLLKI